MRDIRARTDLYYVEFNPLTCAPRAVRGKKF